MIWTLVALLAVSGSADPRLEIVNAQLAGDARAALALTDELLASEPDRWRAMGLDYLRGDLLERLGRRREADAAFAQAMGSRSDLAAHGRYRLALNQSRSGHPEVAAGLLATLLADSPPLPLTEKATRLFADAIARGGDCRLLSRMSSWSLSGASRRLIEISAVDCSQTPQTRGESLERLLRLLEETIVDEPARLAAERIHRRHASDLSRRQDLLLVGRVFHHQRRFDLAKSYLERGLAIPGSAGEDPEDDWEARYALARSHFWQAEYLDAIRLFGTLAETAGRREDAGGALYQQGRSFELYGSREAAANSYRQSYLEDPDGRWAAAALVSTLRIEWLRGREQEALAVFDVLGSRRSWSELHGRAALFLASSDLVQGRTERAESWLRSALRAERSSRNAARYWQGRLEELRQVPDLAVQSYLQVISDTPFHPLADLARERLAAAPLADLARATGTDLAAMTNADALYRAWILLSPTPAAEEALSRATERYRRLPTARPFLGLDFVEPDAWPLWDSPMRSPEDLLVALGMWKEGRRAAERHFPVSSVSLAYTGSRLLSRGGAHRAALRRAEILHQAALSRLPAPLVPSPLRRAVFPLPFGTEIAAAAARHSVDPYLLTALIREESRFDTEAVSAASARGLTQFVLPTARRLAGLAGLAAIEPEDLHRPEVSIELGATYLEELLERFEEREFQTVAAYNAGERQAELWLAYCLSRDPAEYFTKVGFPETRRYLERVFGSRAQYRDLYPPETFHASSAVAQ